MVADLLLVDGHNIAFRCFYGIGNLAREDGFPTGAIYGCAKTIWRMQDSVQPMRTVVFFDVGRCAERTELFPDYKASRKPMAAELRLQLPHIGRLVKLIGCAVAQEKGVEADDLIAAYAAAEANGGKRVAIASSDKDFAQMVCGNITLLVPPPAGCGTANWLTMDADGVKRKFSVEPHQIVDFLSLVGDSVDCIPGVPGVGPKTAAKLLGQYGTVESLMANLDAIAPKLALNLRDSAENISRNRRLIALKTLSHSVNPQWEKFDGVALLNFLEEFSLQSLMAQARRRYAIGGCHAGADKTAQHSFPF
ncbi:MAG: 5'-3' exonuclease [Puniceicoccales bacterium]|jgi:DNA polymerase-1|nr:5'-3' exonuclease [Puniceicoccales bacterium]